MWCVKVWHYYSSTHAPSWLKMCREAQGGKLDSAPGPGPLLIPAQAWASGLAAASPLKGSCVSQPRAGGALCPRLNRALAKRVVCRGRPPAHSQS